MMRKQWIGLVLMAGLVAACGSSAATSNPPANVNPAGATPVVQGATDTPAAAAASALNPCSLITVDEAATALGGPADPGQVSSNGKYCYFYAHGSTDNSVEIYLTDPIQFLPKQSSIAGVFEVTQVSGVGDAAYYVNDVSGGTVGLNMEKGTTTLVVSVALKGSAIPALEALEKTLGIAIAGRL
jgi:hypothetical protein